MRNKIYAIVEGQGEAIGNEPAVVVLVGRILHHLHCFTLFPSKRIPPYRLPYGQFFRDNKLENTLRIHKKYDDCAGVLILLDADDHCPKEKVSELTQRINEMEPVPFSIVVVFAKREYESWFLASLKTIQPDLHFDGDTEEKRDAKGWLRKQCRYKTTRDQSSFTRKIDIELACGNSRSFRRLCHAIEQLAEAQSTDSLVITP